MDLLEVESELSIGLLDLLDESYYSKFDDPFNFMWYFYSIDRDQKIIWH